MTVEELIERLKTCDQSARVVVSMEPLDEDFLMIAALEDVDSLEIGWVDKDIGSVLTFSPKPIADFLVPAVRLLGRTHEATSPNANIVYNGLRAMKEL